MKEKSIGKNFIYNAAYQILVIIAPLITTPYISRVLGPAGNGIYSYTYSIITYFVLVATLGTQNYGQREIAYVQNDREKLSVRFWETVCFRWATTIIAVFFCGFYIVTLKDSERLPYVIQMAYILAVGFDITWFFQGIEEFGKVVYRNSIIKILTIICIFVFIKDENDIYIYLGIMAFLHLVGQISIWPYLPRYVNKAKLKIKSVFRNTKEIISLFIPTVAIQIYTVLDKTMIGIYDTSMVENGYYEQSQKIVKMSLAIITSLSTVMLPRIARSYKENDHAKLSSYMYSSYRFLLMLTLPMAGGLFAIASNLVPWFFGPGYEKVIVLLAIFSLLYIGIGLSTITGIQYLIPTKQQNVYTITVLCGAIVNFILNLILIPEFKSIGAAIASVIAEFTVTFVQFFYVIFVKKTFKLSRIVLPSWKYFCSTIIMLVVVKMVSNLCIPTVSSTVLLGVLGVGVYVLLLYTLRDEFFMKYVKGIIRKTKGLNND